MRNHVTPNDIPGEVREVCSQLHRHGFKAWVVGGCMRDLLREKPASDWDLATSARPEEVQRVFKRVIPTGIQHGTVTVRLHGHSYEVTTLRGEGAYSDGRRPDNVEFVTEIEADLGRRDFTINAIAYDPIDDQLIDPFDGLGDLERGVVRAVGDALRRFSEDGLRVLRAARFAATLEFKLDADTEAAIAPTLETFRRVSAERVREEWLKALKARKPSVAFDIMARTGMLAVTAPMLAELAPSEWRLALAGLDAVEADACLRLAALFAQVRDLGALSEWLTQYRFSNSEREQLLSLLKHPITTLSSDASDADLRRYARKVGREVVFDVAYLGGILAKVRCGQDSAEASAAEALATRLKDVVTDDVALTTKELRITGRDLMVALSITPGPEVGKLLDRLLERVIDDPCLNTREELLSRALELRAEG